MTRAAVFLDRDGVLNEAVVRCGRPHPPATLEDLVLNPEAVHQLPRLRRAGFVLVCVTNQPDVARGLTPLSTVRALNDAVRRELALDDLRCCLHDDGDGCACRKPAPGMLLDAAHDHGIDLSRSVMVGDRWSDVAAGRRAGCRAVLVGSGYSEPPSVEADHRAASLGEAVDWVLAAASGQSADAAR